MPGYRQVRNYTCGYASALMVLRHYRPETNARELFDRLGTGRDGTRQTAIVRELRASGLSANVRYDVDFTRLRTAIDRGKLVIGYLHDIDHWVVLYGYGAAPEQQVYVADPRPLEPCVHGWDAYRPRLRDFGIVCSDPVARPIPLPAPPRRPEPQPDDPHASHERGPQAPQQLPLPF